MIVSILLLAAASVHAQESELAALINEYRSAPQTCEGKSYSPAGPLAPSDALASVNVEPGASLENALQGAGYQAARVQTITVSGLTSARGVMAFIRKRYCSQLLSRRYAEIGVSRKGSVWQILLAQPLLSPELGDWKEAGMRVHELVNDARSEPRSCGGKKFAAAPPLDWNAKLAAAALAHSRDMAKQDYFSHVAPEGGEVGDRASRQSYAWRRIGENIANEQGSPQRVVAGWLASPNHCANIMNADFVEMGAAYAVNHKSEGTIYWTQVLATPKSSGVR